MSKRGLSLEEKRNRMLSFFHEKQDFFNLKEVERLCHKEKGITTMSSKDVLQSLVDDGLVDTDKIGTCVYFWAFPSKLGERLRCRLRAAESALAETRDQRSRLAAELAEAKAAADAAEDGEQDGEAERARLTAALAEAESASSAADERLRRLRDCDPAALDDLLADTRAAHAGTNRWTDNAFALSGWMRAKFPAMDGAAVARQFGIADDIDYVAGPDLGRFG